MGLTVKSEVRSRKSDVRSRKLVVRRKKSLKNREVRGEIRSKKS